MYTERDSHEALDERLSDSFSQSYFIFLNLIFFYLQYPSISRIVVDKFYHRWPDEYDFDQNFPLQLEQLDMSIPVNMEKRICWWQQTDYIILEFSWQKLSIVSEEFRIQ